MRHGKSPVNCSHISAHSLLLIEYNNVKICVYRYHSQVFERMWVRHPLPTEQSSEI